MFYVYLLASRNWINFVWVLQHVILMPKKHFACWVDKEDTADVRSFFFFPSLLLFFPVAGAGIRAELPDALPQGPTGGTGARSRMR